MTEKTLKMFYKIRNSFIIFVIFINCVLNVYSFVSLEPKRIVVHSEDRLISLKCSITWSDLSFDNKTIAFVIKHDNQYKLLYDPDFSNSSFSYKQFNYSYIDWKFLLNETNDSFGIECTVLVDKVPSESSFAQIIFPKGYNESCSEQISCNTTANLVCSNNSSLCQCGPQYIAIQINSTGHYNCYPKVGYNETCVHDRQCRAVDPNTDCGIFDAISKRCQCSEYYAFDGSKCYSDWSDWLCYQWSLHPIDVIIILMALSIGLTLLLIVISISLHLRTKRRRALIDSNTFRYPSSLSAKIIISKYFQKSEDEQYLKSQDYMNK